MTTTAAGIVAEVRQLHGPRRIDITLEDQAVLDIAAAIADGAIPDLYARSGDVSQVREVDDGTGPRLVIRTVDADALRMLLAEHTKCYRVRKTKDGELVETSGLPSASTARAVLSKAEWPKLPILAGVTSMPLIRPDGSVITEPGYDKATRLFYQPAFPARKIPDVLQAPDVEWARRYVLQRVLRDVCWDNDASKANYLALMVTPLLRLYVGGLPPLGVISATTRGSGKTLLTDIMGAVYGLSVKPWAKHDDELGKVITATLQGDTEPVICFDNVGPFDTVDHPNLAALLTAPGGVWSGRVLGTSNNYRGINDRLWLVTGNNVALGGDIASRSVLVRLDPKREDPEERDGFAIDDLWSWLRVNANRADLLAALLILVRSWIDSGAARVNELRMRNFSSWAQAMGGFLAHHKIPGFLANKKELATHDEEETTTAAFLTKWHKLFGDARQRASGLVASARADLIGNEWHDQWDGAFPSKPDGKPFTAAGLAKFLGARRGRIFGGLVLVGEYDDHAKVWWYSVRPVEASQDEGDS